MGIFDKILDVFVIDDSEKKPKHDRVTSNIDKNSVRRRRYYNKSEITPQSEKVKNDVTCQKKIFSPATSESSIKDISMNKISRSQERDTPRADDYTIGSHKMFIDAEETSDSDTANANVFTYKRSVIPQKKETLAKLQNEKNEIIKLFGNDTNRLNDMGNTLICETDDIDHESLIWDLLTCYSPEHLKLIMMDETGIAYSPFQGMSYLLIPNVTDPKKCIGAINWVYAETKCRFKQFMDTGTRNIDNYNSKVANDNDLRSKQLPYILVVVHEIDIFEQENYTAFYDTLNSLLLNGMKAGIFFLLFSRYSPKNLSLRKELDLLSIKTISEAKSFFHVGTLLPKNELIYSDTMTGLEFENFCCNLLQLNGYNQVKITKASADYGCDLVAVKDQIRYAIQCKKYNTPVGITAVQEVIASRSVYNCHVAVVLTNSSFTSSATKLALENNVLLWDGKRLQSMYEKTIPEEKKDKDKLIDSYEEQSNIKDLVNRLMNIELQLSRLQPSDRSDYLPDSISKMTGYNSIEDRDEYFEAAARFVMEKNKATIGMIQRMFKIGFNRSARIMDQLAEAGIVGKEEGTKPREILMTPEQLDKYFEEYF